MLCAILDALCDFPKYMPLPTIPNECSNSPNPLLHPPAMSHTSATLSPFYTANNRQRPGLQAKGQGKDLPSSSQPFTCPKAIQTIPSSYLLMETCLFPTPRRFSLAPKLNFSHCSSSPILSRHRKHYSLSSTPFYPLKGYYPLSPQHFHLEKQYKPSQRTHPCSLPSVWRILCQVWMTHCPFPPTQTHIQSLPHSYIVQVLSTETQRDTAYPTLPTLLALDGSNHCRLRLRAAFWTPSKGGSGNGENPGVLA